LNELRRITKKVGHYLAEKWMWQSGVFCGFSITLQVHVSLQLKNGRKMTICSVSSQVIARF